jgi:hypothetical protein
VPVGVGLSDCDRESMPVAVRSKSSLIDETAGLNPAEGVVLGVLCFFMLCI